jgi:tripartite-type tricarboxylate transporter receptor subunit TctC
MLQRRTLGRAGLGALLAVPALAQAPWPNRPIRLIIPWPPGQQTDVINRLVGDFLSRKLGQPVIPENRAGAGGSIGTDLVAKAAPDGYTLLGASVGPITFAPLIRTVPYDSDRELATVTSYGRGPYLLVARPDFPAADARAFLAELKRSPGKYSYASSGIGGAQHLLSAMFFARAEVDVLHVPFQGSGAAMTALMAGQVDCGMETPAAAAALVREGRLKAYGQSLGRPSALLPGVAPISEAAGVPGYDVGGWIGMMAPAGTPREIVDRLAAAVKEQFEDATMRERLGQMGLEAAPTSPEEFRALLHRLRDEFGPIIRRLGIRAE